jgi:Domain of unknown function (DUF4105)
MPNAGVRPGPLAIIVRVLLKLVAIVLVLFCAAALWFDGPEARWLAAGLAVALLALTLVVLLLPARVALLLGLLPSVAVLVWWLSLEPRNDRDWQPDVARVAQARFDGDIVTIENVRNAAYRSETDYDARWETRTYDLQQIVGLDLFLVYWGPALIAHTILSWEFADGQHLAISIETRKEVGEEYSAVRGFFRQYELYYVVADERDVIRLRTDFRGEDVYLYRLRTPPERARALLRQYLERINRLGAEPEWYNALDQNCTTVIFDHVRPIVGHVPFDVRMLANGHLDEMLHDMKVVNASMPFETLRAASHVTEAAMAAGDADDFSARIRAVLPDRPPPPPPGR